MVKIPFTAKAFINLYGKRLAKGSLQAVKARESFIVAISPEDSWDYVSHHKIEGPKLRWTEIVTANVNDSEHAFWVEFWFSKTPVNWSKEDWTTIYTGIWANVMQRATEVLKKQTIDIITRAIDKW